MIVIQFPDGFLTYRGYRHYTRIGAVTEQIRDDASLSVGMITAVDMQEFILILRAMNHPIVASFMACACANFRLSPARRPPIMFIILKAAALWASSYSKSIGKGAIYRLASSDNESSASNPLFLQCWRSVSGYWLQ